MANFTLESLLEKYWKNIRDVHYKQNGHSPLLNESILFWSKDEILQKLQTKFAAPTKS